MSIQFKRGGHPTARELLDQAAGVGIEFEPDSLKELHFLDFCRTLYTAGVLDGIVSMRKQIWENFHE